MSSSITEAKDIYVPSYAQFKSIYDEHERAHWLPDEADMGVDVEQWKSGVISESEKAFIKMVLRLFTQSDKDVLDAYYDKLIPVFKNPDVRNMLGSFANRESTHVLAYKLLNDTLGYDSEEFMSEFLEYAEMKSKHDFMVESVSLSTERGKAEYLAKQTLMEGVNLFASFAMLLSFSQDGKLPGMVSINQWSQADESCFRGDTEILTEKGWQRFDNLDKNLKVAQYNMGTGEASFTLPYAFVEKDYEGELVALRGMNTSVEVTADHEILFTDCNTVTPMIKKVKAVDFKPHYRRRLPITASKGGSKDHLTYFERFLIALQADGNLDRRAKDVGKYSGCAVVNFKLKKQRKIQRLEWLLSNLNFEYSKTYSANDEMYSFRVKAPLEFELVKTFKEWHFDFETVSSSWCFEFIDEVLRWDGHIKGDTLSYSSNDKDNADFVQTVAMFAGYRTHVGIREDYRWEDTKYQYTLNFTTYTEQPTGSVEKITSYFKGKVYCVSVPDGNIITRHNDKITITGNCHIAGISGLFREHVKEHPRVVTDSLKASIYETARKVVELEDDFIDLCFSVGSTSCIDKEALKKYIRFVCDYRMQQLGFKAQFGVEENPIEWMDKITGNTFGNFFETTITQYSKANLTGDWIYPSNI